MKNVSINSQKTSSSLPIADAPPTYTKTLSFYFDTSTAEKNFPKQTEYTDLTALSLDNIYVEDTSEGDTLTGTIYFLKLGGIRPYSGYQLAVVPNVESNGLVGSVPFVVGQQLYSPIPLMTWANSEGRIDHKISLSILNDSGAVQSVKGFITLSFQTTKFQK